MEDRNPRMHRPDLPLGGESLLFLTDEQLRKAIEAGVAVGDTELRDAVEALAKHSFPKFEVWTALKNAWKRWQTTLEMAYLYHFRTDTEYVDDRVISPITLMIKPARD